VDVERQLLVACGQLVLGKIPKEQKQPYCLSMIQVFLLRLSNFLVKPHKISLALCYQCLPVAKVQQGLELELECSP